MNEILKPLLGKLSIFAKQRMGFAHPPKLFLKSDPGNSQKALGKTAYYDPNEKSITLFTHSRHPKDILRSYSHELVHHTQNLRGDLSPEKCGEMGTGYAQNNGHMRNMEKEAYLKGNMCFRDWEDSLEDKDIYIIKIAESKFLKENNSMTKKITKEFLKETIKRLLSEDSGMRDIEAAVANIARAKELQGANSEVGPDEVLRRQIAAALPTMSIQQLESIASLAGVDSFRGNNMAKSLEEEEELEEASQEEFAKNRPPYDEATAADRAGDDGKPKNESKIQTPEQETSLYESRFAGRNNRLFENLTKKWTK